MIGVGWFACAPEPAPPVDPDPPEQACPPIDWIALYDQSLSEHQLSRVVVLPGGDLLVGGMGGTGALGFGPKGRISHDHQGRVVARLGTDGVARWAHSVGTGYSSATAIGWTERSVWVAGQHVFGTFALDNVPIEGAPAFLEGYRQDAFAARFDLDTGEMDRWLYVGGEESQEALAVAEDDRGNVYVTGTYDSPTLDLGGGFVLRGPRQGANAQSDWAWLASWDPQGQVRWVTGAPYASGRGVAVKGRTLLWNLHGGDHGWIRSDGTTTPFDRLEEKTTQVIYPVDPDTGAVLPARAAIYGDNAYWEELGVDRAGDLTATGSVIAMQSPATWTPPNGEPELIGPKHEGDEGVVLVFDETGAVQSLDALPINDPTGGDASQRVFTGTMGGSGVVFNAGTASEFHLEGHGSTSGWTGVAGLVDERGQVPCAWSFHNTHPRVPDAVLDDDGGLVVVGAFTTTMELRDRTNTVIHTFEKPVGNPTMDGFVIHFAWPEAE